MISIEYEENESSTLQSQKTENDEEISAIREKISNTHKYNVSFSYDENGLINNIKIEY